MFFELSNKMVVDKREILCYICNPFGNKPTVIVL